MGLVTQLRTAGVILTLLSLPLVVGSSCFFAFSSGGNSSDKPDKDKDDETIVVVKTGSFGDPAADGITYESGSLKGVTGSGGAFQYEQGHAVQFSIGDIDLGAPVPGKAAISPQDLAAGEADATVATVNIRRLLQSLDDDPGDAVVTIPSTVRSKAVRGNATVASAIEFLDFSDEAAFINSASQLVAALTADYPYTATLLDGDSVQADKTRSVQLER